MSKDHTSQLPPDCLFNQLSFEDRLKFGFSMNFAKCVIQKRQELGWTQEELAEQSGVNRVTIAKLEKFHRTASIDVVLKLLYALRMEIKFVDLS